MLIYMLRLRLFDFLWLYENIKLKSEHWFGSKNESFLCNFAPQAYFFCKFEPNLETFCLNINTSVSTQGSLGFNEWTLKSFSLSLNLFNGYQLLGYTDPFPNLRIFHLNFNRWWIDGRHTKSLSHKCHHKTRCLCW